MMTKTDHINFWIQNAAEDWATMQDLLNSGRRVYALFFMHLTIEKTLKAHWIKDNASTMPPFTHDLRYIANQTDLELNSDQYNLLGAMQAWNIESRYPDFKRNLDRIASKEYVADQFKIVHHLRECLLEKISTGI